MRKKEITRIFKTEIESHIPDSAPKIDFEFAPKQAQKTPFGLSLTKNLTTVLAILVMALVVGFLAQPNPSQTPTRLLASEAEVISFSALSTVSLLAEQANNIPVSWTPTLNLNGPTPLIDHVRPYLSLVEKVMANDQGFNIMTGPSDYEAYDTSMQFETRDLLGNITFYTMHYNLVLVDEDDDESEYVMDGILITDALIYQVEGEKVIEADEQTLSFKAMLDEQNYVESESKIESDEESFEFKVVRYGQTVSEIQFEIEYEDDEIGVNLEFTEGEDEGSFEFEYVTEDGQNLIYIEFETTIDNVSVRGEMTVLIVVDPVTNNTSYRFYVDPDDDDAYEYETDRDDDDDDDEEEESEEETPEIEDEEEEETPEIDEDDEADDES